MICQHVSIRFAQYNENTTGLLYMKWITTSKLLMNFLVNTECSITTLSLYVHRPESHIGVARIWQGGPIFFPDWKMCMSQRIARGVWGLVHQRIFLNGAIW